MRWNRASTLKAQSGEFGSPFRFLNARSPVNCRADVTQQPFNLPLGHSYHPPLSTWTLISQLPTGSRTFAAAPPRYNGSIYLLKSPDRCTPLYRHDFLLFADADFFHLSNVLFRQF